MEIKKIKKVNVGEQVFLQLQQLLSEGKWKQGEKLPSENDLSAMFGVSRITVRQAIQRLSAMGLLETRHGEGTFVQSLEAGDSLRGLIPTAYLADNSLSQVNEFREMIDTESARLAALHATEEDIHALRDNYEAMMTVNPAQHPHRFAHLDLGFHTKLGKISRNMLIMKTYEVLYDVLINAMLQTIEDMGGSWASIYHRQIIDAVEAHDSELAARLAREHVANNRECFDASKNR